MTKKKSDWLSEYICIDSDLRKNIDFEKKNFLVIIISFSKTIVASNKCSRITSFENFAIFFMYKKNAIF